MKTLCLTLGLVSLAFCLGCGSGNNNSGGKVPMGNFSDANLNGPYTYQFSGFDLNTGLPYVRSGVFMANGAGTISRGMDDFSEGVAASTPITGSYSISVDGTGTLNLTFPTGTLQWAITLVSSAKVYLVETSTTPLGAFTGFTGAGTADQQGTVAFTAPPTGTFVFRNFFSNATFTSTSNVGTMTIATGPVTAGKEDLVTIGVSGLSSPTLTGGVFNLPDATNGRGTGSYTDSSGTTNTFIYYMVSVRKFRLFLTTSTNPLLSIGLGSAEQQTGGPFTNASLSGNYAFGFRGDTAFIFSGQHAVGRYTADGNGNLTAGKIDSMQDGTAATNASFTGTYAMDASGNGRAVLTLSSSASPQIYWMVSPSRAFFLINDSTQATEGTADLQTVGSFSNSSVNGQFGFLMDGILLTSSTVDTLDRVATLQWDGAGHLTLNEFINISGTPSTSGFLSGTYKASSNGRTTGQIMGATNNINLVFYLVSGSNAYALQTDAGAEVDGMTMLQQ
jgi:hypothetical protein